MEFHIVLIFYEKFHRTPENIRPKINDILCKYKLIYLHSQQTVHYKLANSIPSLPSAHFYLLNKMNWYYMFNVLHKLDTALLKVWFGNWHIDVFIMKVLGDLLVFSKCAEAPSEIFHRNGSREHL
jgi:hypothetical protein